MTDDTFNHADRSGFVERLGRLAGKTTWREPTGAGYTPYVSGSLSSENAMVLALSMGRRNPADIGPEILYTIATGMPHRRERVVAWLAAKLLRDTGPMGRKCQGKLNILAQHCYEVVGIGHAVTPLPGRLPVAWDKLRDIGIGWLWMAAESSVERAEYALRKDGPPRRARADETA